MKRGFDPVHFFALIVFFGVSVIFVAGMFSNYASFAPVRDPPIKQGDSCDEGGLLPEWARRLVKSVDECSGGGVPLPTCEDIDSPPGDIIGENYFVRGKARIVSSTGQVIDSSSDEYCNSGTSEEASLVEHYCSTDLQTIKTKSVLCQSLGNYICYNGACVYQCTPGVIENRISIEGQTKQILGINLTCLDIIRTADNQASTTINVGGVVITIDIGNTENVIVNGVSYYLTFVGIPDGDINSVSINLRCGAP